jgi:uncharacterized protein (TIGR02996 family)
MTNAERILAAVSDWQRDARVEALTRLLELWREWKSLDLGDLIAQLTTLAATGRAPIRPSSAGSAAQVWRELAAKEDPLDLPRLLEPIPAAITSLQRERGEVLKEWPPHPLLTRTVLEWWKKPELRVRAMMPSLFELARASADPLMSGPLQALMPTHLAATRRVGRMHAKAAMALAVEAREWVAPVETEAETHALEALEALLQAAPPPSHDSTALFQKVYAAPDDDALRALLADALVSQGDVRGEFISMQLLRGDAPPSAAEKKLVAQWGEAWLGRLAPCFRKQGVVFRRGFPGHGRYEKGGEPTWPEWSTFESLDCTPASGFVGGGMSVLQSEHLRSLKSAVGLGGAILETRDRMPDFFSIRTTPWHTVGFLCDGRLVPVVGELLTIERFPKVHTLVLGAPVWGGLHDEFLLAAMKQPWFRQVRHLDVTVLEAAGVVGALSRPFDSLVVRDRHGSAFASLKDRHLELVMTSAASRAPEVLLLMLEHLPGSAYERVTLTLPRGKREGTMLVAGPWKKVELGPLLARLDRLSVPVTKA